MRINPNLATCIAFVLTAAGGASLGYAFAPESPPSQVVTTSAPPAPAVVLEPPTYVEALSDFSHRFPACEFEFSEDCFWDASTRGNGRGKSFVDLDGTAWYLDSTNRIFTSLQSGDLILVDADRRLVTRCAPASLCESVK